MLSLTVLLVASELSLVCLSIEIGRKFISVWVSVRSLCVVVCILFSIAVTPN